MRRLNCVHSLGAALVLWVAATASIAQQTTTGASQAPCTPAATDKKPFNPSAALASINNGWAKLKEAASNVGNAAKAAGAAAQAATSGTPSTSSPCAPAAESATTTTAAAAPSATLAATGGAVDTPATGAQPWTPPADAPAAPAAFAGPLDPAKLPEIGGIHLGMSLAEARAPLQKLYPTQRIAQQPDSGPDAAHLSVGTLRIGDQASGIGGVDVDLTLPPSAQAVYHVTRMAPQPHVARAVLLAALRQKYGKEAFATGPAGVLTSDDTRVYQLWWVYDERGNPVSGTQLQNGSPFGCANYIGSGSNGYYMTVVRGTSSPIPSWCAASFVGVRAQLGPDQIFDRFQIEMVDMPLLVRAARATAASMNRQAEQARQQNLERAQEVKPQL